MSNPNSAACGSGSACHFGTPMINPVDIQIGNQETQIKSLSLFSPNVENTETINTMSSSAVNPEPTEFSSTEGEGLSVGAQGKHEGTHASLSYSSFIEDTVTMNTILPSTVNVPGKREGTLESLSFSPSTKNIRTMNTMSTTAGKVTEEAYTTKRASRNGSIQRRSVLLWNLGCFIMSVWDFSV